VAARNGPCRGEAQVAAALALGATYLQAGQAGGVGERTVKRWVATRPTFRRLVADLTAQGLDEARRVVTAATPAAARRLVALALEPSSLTPDSRRRALCDVLDRAERAHDNTLVEQRLAAIEARLDELGVRRQ
jgi:hypothetical protein